MESVSVKQEKDMMIEALQAYGMESASYELIRHNENITCKIESSGEKYVLRIHQPLEGFQTSLVTGNLSEMELFQSEADLLLHLSENGMKSLQKPLKNREGGYVTELRNGTPAMLLSWVEGTPITPGESSRYAKEIGQMACRIHIAARGFKGPRIHYDNALCDRMKEEAERAVSLGHIKELEGKACIHELEAVKKAQKRQEALSAPAIIHADLGFGNIIVTKNGLVPIDFSLSGYASPAQEAGMLMSNYQDEISCQNVLKGFSSCGVDIDRKDAEIFLSYSVLLFICAQHRKMYQEEWFPAAMERWCSTLFIHE